MFIAFLFIVTLLMCGSLAGYFEHGKAFLFIHGESKDQDGIIPLGSRESSPIFDENSQHDGNKVARGVTG